MKKLLLILFFLPLLTYAQSTEEQVVVKYSIDYEVPFMKRMFKKMFPTSCTNYYSEDAYRVDISHSFSVLGIKGKMEGFEIYNYSTMQQLSMMKIIASKSEEQEDTTEYTKEDIIIDTISTINYTEERKNILDIECIGFIIENDEETIKGFLTTEFSAIGAIIDGKDLGLPMQFESYNKEEKMTAIFTAEEINLEPLHKSYYLIE